MANKMLIDATHPEETRVVVLRGNRVEEFDFESAHRKQLRGNIYLAKVTRVEPSLQAAFVDYGGNRHGFLAFSEIHPDYYQIPIADRQALIAEEERAQRAAMDDVERVPRRTRESARSRRDDDVIRGEAAEPLAADILEGEPSAAESAGKEGSSEYSEGDLESGAPREEAPSWSFESPEAPAAGISADQVETAIVDEDAEAIAQETQDSVASAEEIEEVVSSLPAETENDQALPPTEARSPAGGGEEDDEVVESVGGADA